MTNTQAITAESRAFVVDFIDPLFAVAVHIGFTHGLMNEKWLQEWRWPVAGENFGTFFLGFLTLLTSWVGYHQSIRKKPVGSYARFVIDVVLVLLYAVLLVKYNDFRAVLLILVWIYWLFFVWDLFKVREYRALYDEGGLLRRYHRELVTLVWAIVFTGIWVFNETRWFGIGATTLYWFALVSTLLYRLNKTKYFSEIISNPLVK